MTSKALFTVYMDSKLVDELVGHFSPLDGLHAIDSIFLDLPKMHQSHASKRKRRQPQKTFKVYHGRFSWYDLGFNYVEEDDCLRVIDLWIDEDWNKPNRHEVDVVLGEPGPLQEISVGSGVSILTNNC